MLRLNIKGCFAFFGHGKVDSLLAEINKESEGGYSHDSIT